jgi:hypothetical protein
MLAFERLEWAATFNARHDIGTDLLLSPRTPQGVDLSLLIAAQVKSGKTAFRSKTNVSKGEPDGWWFRDDKRSHVDAWASHALPFLIILHDEEREQTYWAHVTPEAIHSTGKGAKVLVPKAHQVDEENREALVAVAESIRSGSNWEGSAWSGMAPPRAEDGLRYALIAPRLVAPHPNIGTKEPIEPVQGIALLVQGRARDYESFAETHSGVPSLDEARTSNDWGWRLVGALAQRLFEDDLTPLLALNDSAPDPSSHAAVVVVSACALLDQGEVDQAVAILEDAIDEVKAGAIDRAWLEVQHARLCVEVGRIGEARHAALAVQQIGASVGSDVTAGALAGAAAALLFNTSRWEPEDLENAISFGDTAVTWWRSQTTRQGLDALADRHFKAWVRQTGITFAAEDTVAVQLLSASTLANHAADQGGWRRLTALQAQASLFELDRHATGADAAPGLVALIRAGESKSVEKTVRHLFADGPAEAVALAAQELRLDAASRTTAHAELALLQHGGAALERDVADRAARFLIRRIFNDVSYRKLARRISPTFLLDVQLLESLAGVIPATGLRVQRELIKRLVRLEPQKHQVLATAWRKVVLGIPRNAWTGKTMRQAKPKPRQHESSLQLALLGVAAAVDQGARRSLIERARGGSLGAISAIGDVTGLPRSAVRAQIRKLAKAVEGQAEEARRGSYGMPVFDLGQALVVLNLWHPQLARWDSLLELLAEPRASGEHKSGAIAAMARSPERIPQRLRGQMGKIALGISAGDITSGPVLFEPGEGLIGRATILALGLGAIDVEQSADPYVELLAGEHRKRVWAAHVATRLARDRDVGVLAVLCDDSHPSVRAAAAAGLAQLFADGKGGSLGRSALCHAVEDSGTWVPRAIAAQLAAADSREKEAEDLLRSLRRHRFVPVRDAAAGRE